jgi:plasmid stability protein
MEQVIIRRLRDGTLDDYRRLAADKGRSLEAELRELIERNRPLRKKDSAYLLALSERLQAMTPDGARLRDSTDLIRWDRDTNHGDWVDDGWQDDDAGH